MAKTKIWFTGSHGTGKTTQADYFHTLHPEYSVMNMERRELHHKGIINLNRRAAPWDEVVIGGNAMLAILSTSAPFISDRSWICKCAYAQACPFDQELLDAWHTVNTMSFPGMSEQDVYFYFPPTIPLEDDGVRSTDKDYQHWIDNLVQFYLSYFSIPFHTIEGETIQDRNFEIERVVFE